MCLVADYSSASNVRNNLLLPLKSWRKYVTSMDDRKHPGSIRSWRVTPSLHPEPRSGQGSQLGTLPWCQQCFSWRSPLSWGTALKRPYLHLQTGDKWGDRFAQQLAAHECWLTSLGELCVYLSTCSFWGTLLFTYQPLRVSPNHTVCH